MAVPSPTLPTIMGKFDPASAVDVRHAHAHLLTLDVVRFFLISRCTRRAHTASLPTETLELSLQSIMGQLQLATPRTAWSRKFRPACAKSCRCSKLNFGPPALLYDPTRCDTPLVKTQWILDFYQDKQSSLPIRVLNAKEATTTRPVHAKLRDASQLHYSHSIISREVSSLIWKHNSSRVTDKRRRYIRRNFLILNSQKKLPLTKRWQFRYLSESIGWMAHRVRSQGDSARTGTELQIPSEIRKRPSVPTPLIRLLCGSHTGRSAFKSCPLRQFGS